MRELQDNGYINIVKIQINGQWRTSLKLTKKGKSAGHTDDGFSGALYSCTTINNLVTNDLTTSDNSYVVLEVVTNVTTSNTRKFQKEEISKNKKIIKEILKPKGIEMVWPIDEPEIPKRKFRLTPETDDDVGSVRKIVDKQAMRNP